MAAPKKADPNAAPFYPDADDSIEADITGYPEGTALQTRHGTLTQVEIEAAAERLIPPAG